MEGVDSPLEVLSLAATMVQDSCLPPSYEEARARVLPRKEPKYQGPKSPKSHKDPKDPKELKDLPSARWRRERRARDRLPDYVMATGDSERACSESADAPLDMSTRARLPEGPPTPHAFLRGSPPSYSEAISKPGYRQSSRPRPSVITSTSLGSKSPMHDSERDDPQGTKEEFTAGDGMCDPVIDEHFRRSLGKDYMNIFAKPRNGNSNTQPKDTEKEDKGLAITGLSVDDHFAKALGDTWLKLQAESKSAPSPRKAAFPTKTAKKAPAVSSTTLPKEAPNTSIPQRRRGVVTI